MGRDGARPSRGKTMVRNDQWSFDQDLEAVRSLGAALDGGSFVWSGEGRRPTLRVTLVPRLQGIAALQGQGGPLQL